RAVLDVVHARRARGPAGVGHHGAGVAGVADPVAIGVGLVGVVGVGAVVGGIGLAVAVLVEHVGHGTALARRQRTQVARVADPVGVGVGLRALVERAHRVEHVGAIVLRVGQAVAVGIVG